jgi:hypothetical protein
MYSVKVHSTKLLRSWHPETPAGLQQAIEEAQMRTHARNLAHEVTDNHGLRLYLALPTDVKAKLKADASLRRAEYLVAWVAFVILLVSVCTRR